MEAELPNLIAQGFCGADRCAGGVVPRPYGSTVHGEQVGNVVYIDSLHLGESERTDGANALDGYHFVVVLLEGISGYLWLVPAKSFMENAPPGS